MFREKVSTSVEIPFSAETKRVLQFAAEEADRLLHNYIGTEHLLLGILREERSVAATILMEKGMRLNTVREDIVALLNEKTTLTRVKETPLLAEFSRDLTEAAMKNQLDPLVGRHIEIERVQQVLCRRTKNNAVLIGEPGVGKTAIVEGLGAEDRLRRRAAFPRRQAAARPRHFADRRRHEVSRSVRRAPEGDHEGADREPEHHRLHRRAAHAGRRGVGGGFARRGQHPEAGAVARRDSLHRRDDAVGVPQVHREGPLARAPLPGDQGRSADASAKRSKCCTGVKDRYESFHHVEYTSEAIEAAVYQSNRYITDRFLPDKAIDLIDEAGARAKLREAGYSEEFGEINRSIRVAVEQMETAVSEKNFEKAQFYREQEVQARENLQFVREKFDVKSSTRRVVVGKARDRRGRVEVDGRAADVDQSGRRRQAPAHGRRAAQARRLAGCGHLGAVTGHSPLARRAQDRRTGRSAASSSSARPASAKPNWHGRSRTSCSAAITRSSASTCPSTWRSTRCRS